MNGANTRIESTGEVEQALKTARIVCGALVAAVLVYAGLAWYLARSETVAAVDAGTANLLKQAFVAVMLIGVLGWMVIWGRARAPTPSTVARPEVELREGPRGVVRTLIAAYAFLEAVGLVGATVHLLTGSLGVLLTAVAVVALGAALSWPREEWFQRFLEQPPA
jgi:cytochrome bd-type quinol oxidase subunit 2